MSNLTDLDQQPYANSSTATTHPRGTSPVAVAAIVLAFLAPIVGLILGLVAITQTGPGKRPGRGLAIAAMIVGGLFTVVGAVILAVLIWASGGEDSAGNVGGENTAAQALVDAPARAEDPADAPAGDAAAMEFSDLTRDEWGAVVRDPSSAEGRAIRFYGTVFQFDTNTGNGSMLVNGGATQPAQEYEYADTVFLSGDEALFSGMAEDDVVRVEGVVDGALDYETLMGGNNSATAVKVSSITVVGLLDLTPDVTVGAYTSDEYGGGELAITVMNNGGVPYTYSVSIAATSSDGATQYDTSSSSVDNLAPGQAAPTAASFFEDLPADAIFTITQVERYAP